MLVDVGVLFSIVSSSPKGEKDRVEEESGDEEKDSEEDKVKWLVHFGCLEKFSLVNEEDTCDWLTLLREHEWSAWMTS